jgi:hypothetical protein
MPHSLSASASATPAPTICLPAGALVNVLRKRRQVSNLAAVTRLQGLDGAQPAVRAALLAFMLHMAAGAVDAAIAAMKRVRAAAVWRTMAAVAVRSRQLPVLELCLANLDDLPAARALRQVKERHAAGQDEAAARAELLGAAATHLGLIEDAVAIYTDAGAWAPLVKLYRALGRWDDALRVRLYACCPRLSSVNEIFQLHACMRRCPNHQPGCPCVA